MQKKILILSVLGLIACGDSNTYVTTTATEQKNESQNEVHSPPSVAMCSSYPGKGLISTQIPERLDAISQPVRLPDGTEVRAGLKNLEKINDDLGGYFQETFLIFRNAEGVLKAAYSLGTANSSFCLMGPGGNLPKIVYRDDCVISVLSARQKKGAYSGRAVRTLFSQNGAIISEEILPKLDTTINYAPCVVSDVEEFRDGSLALSDTIATFAPSPIKVLTPSGQQLDTSVFGMVYGMNRKGDWGLQVRSAGKGSGDKCYENTEFELKRDGNKRSLARVTNCP